MSSEVTITLNETIVHRIEMTDEQYDRFLAEPGETLWSGEFDLDNGNVRDTQIADHFVLHYRPEPVTQATASRFTPAFGEKVVASPRGSFRDKSLTSRTGTVVGFGFASDSAIVEFPYGERTVSYNWLAPLHDASLVAA